MKKFKLITSLCVMALTVCCLAFGVYAAVNASFTASGTVTFNAYSCDVAIDCSVSGYSSISGDSTAYRYAGNPGTIASKLGGTNSSGTINANNVAGSSVSYTAGSVWNFGDLVFDQLGNVPEGKGAADIVFTFVIRSWAGYDLKLTTSNFATTTGITCTQMVGTGSEASNATTSLGAGYTIEKNTSDNGLKTTILLVTYSVDNTVNTETSIDFTSNNMTLGFAPLS